MKSFYFYMKFSRLIQITKPVKKQKKGKKNKRLFSLHSHFRKCEIYMKFILYCGCRWKWTVIIAVNFQFKQLAGRSDDHSSLSSTTEVQYTFHTYILHIISLHGKTWIQQIDLAPNVWLHSSLGRASPGYRGVHGFESRWSPDIFQASSFQLLK